MRLRHKKWADQLLKENSDISANIVDLDKTIISSFTSLEIGCGCGMFLLSLAMENKNEKYLGVEVNKNAFAIAVKKASSVKDETDNFYFVQSPIEKLFEFFLDMQLNNIYINFPDPWPKVRQQHRRLTYPDKLKEYYRILKDDGKIYFRTDNKFLFSDSVAYFKSSDLYDIEIIEPFYSENVSYLPSTEYEKKFRDLNVDIHLLIASKKQKSIK